MKRLLLLGMVLSLGAMPCEGFPQSQLEPPIPGNMIDWLALFRQRFVPPDVPTLWLTYDVPELTISPAEPQEFSNVYVTISGFKPDPDLEVEREDINTKGHMIQVTLHWSGPEGTAAQQMSETSVPYEHTVCLGWLARGYYTVRVTHSGAMSGAGCVSFKVKELWFQAITPIEVTITVAD